MLLDRGSRSAAILWALIALGTGILLGLLAAEADGARASRPAAPAPAPDTIAFPEPAVRATPVNLQSVFANEVNAKARYELFAQRAERDGEHEVAGLFRACAAAESIHARRDVEAIALSGDPARAVLDRVEVGLTSANLETSLQRERYEVGRYYPALIARARADHVPGAVRCMTYALSAEREHVALLESARSRLGQGAAAHVMFVCSGCGKTVAKVDFVRCPNCYASARRFMRVR